MAQAQHTPGPWRLNAGNETLVMGSNQRPIARAECGGIAGIGLAEAEANARLIAAAPDLLAALEEMAAVFGWQSPNANPTVDAAIAAARALLARIKGEAV